MKICIIGNGSLSMFTAARLIKSIPKAQLTIIGPSNRNYGASAAAGLMLNIFSEIDLISFDMPLTKWKLSNWHKALKKWEEFFSNNGFILKKQIYSSFGTKIYCDKNSTNKLEKQSFLKLSEIAKKYNTIEETIKKNEIFLPYENSVDARFVLKLLDDFVKENAIVVNDYVDQIKLNQNNIDVLTKSDQKSLRYDKVILAAGSASSQILENSYLNDSNIPICLNGIGSAIEIFSELEYIEELNTKHILRSPNRGGTCGIHMVQRSNSIYVGASSVVTDKNLKSPRLGSIETLINGAKKELGLGNIVRQSLNILTGYRPISQDAVPIFGELNKNLFLCYGHKRDGFTWAPFLSEIVDNWINNISFNSEFHKYLDMCNPHRKKFASYGSYEQSKKLYLLNEEFSYAQHKEIFDEDTEKKLISRFDSLHSTKRFKDSICHPELVNINYFLGEKL